MTVRRSWKGLPRVQNTALTWELEWSYGDSNPRPLACHGTQTHPPSFVTVPRQPPWPAGLFTRVRRCSPVSAADGNQFGNQPPLFPCPLEHHSDTPATPRHHHQRSLAEHWPRTGAVAQRAVHTSPPLPHTRHTPAHPGQRLHPDGLPARRVGVAVVTSILPAPATPPPARTATGSDPGPSDPGQHGNRAADSAPQVPGLTAPGHGARSWPLLLLAAPAAVAVWSGWVGIGQMTGFGQVHPLPGIWNNLHLNTAVTLPVGVEAYAAYALRAWLSPSPAISARTRAFARRSVIASLLLGMAGQVAYHLLIQAHATTAPWPITTAVACLPVLVLGMGAALAHLLRADNHHNPPTHNHTDHTHPGQSAAVPARPEQAAQAQAAANQLRAAGRPVSRRTLRECGIRGSNAHLGALARIINRQPTPEHNTSPSTQPPPDHPIEGINHPINGKNPSAVEAPFRLKGAMNGGL